MIIVRLEGGLGNTMFQYSLGRHLAHKNAAELKFDVNSYETNLLGDYSLALEGFNIEIGNRIATSQEIAKFQKYRRKLGRIGLFYNKIFADETKYVEEKSTKFNPAVFEIKDPAYLRGWWQSERYFLTIRNILLEDFTLRESLKEKNKEIANYAQITSSVGIHIRRRDYVTNPRTRAYHGELTKEYYQAGLSHITKNISRPVLFIFSDDTEWVKQNMPFPFETIYVEGNMTNPHKDIYLMSLCKNHIIANSSFGWWGAWLSQNPNQIVVAPKKWTNDPKDYNGRIPANWTRI